LTRTSSNSAMAPMICNIGQPDVVVRSVDLETDLGEWVLHAEL
jgi:hypothetical protein